MRASDTVILLAGVAVILALAAAPSRAQECVPVEAVLDTLDAAGGELVDILPVPGQTVDHLIFATVNGALQMWGVGRGCMVGQAIPLDAAKPPPVPA